MPTALFGLIKLSMKDLYQLFSQSLDGLLHTYSINIAPPLWEIPKDKKYGDFSTMIALKAAPVLKRDPYDIACEIKSVLQEKLGSYTDRIDIVKPGFVNIFVSKKGLIESLNRIIKEKDDFFKDNRRKKVLLEFVSANPTGPLSIAHGRQAVVGDVIARILKFFGNDVICEYYLNDEGTQINLLIESVRQRIKELKGEDFRIPDGGYQGEYLKSVAREAFDIEEDKLRDFVVSSMVSLIKNELSSIGVVFDNFFSQKKLINEGKVNKAIETLSARGLIYEKDSALWFSSSRFGDDKDRVLKKKNSELTYFASDIAYHEDKIERGFDEIINLWGPDHHGYIGRVKASIKALGYNDNILKVLIIQLVTIKTKERMSRRRGTAILLSDLIDEVGKDAVRFYYILRRNSSPLEFDIDLAKSASLDNPLYYVQYAHARIKSIFAKAGVVDDFNLDYSQYLEDEEEVSLVRDILQFSYCLNKIYYNLEPVFLAEYLKSIAAEFHRFYERKRILGSGDDKMHARLNLLEAVRVVLRLGLSILGISAWDKM